MNILFFCLREGEKSLRSPLSEMLLKENLTWWKEHTQEPVSWLCRIRWVCVPPIRKDNGHHPAKKLPLFSTSAKPHWARLGTAYPVFHQGAFKSWNILLPPWFGILLSLSYIILNPKYNMYIIWRQVNKFLENVSEGTRSVMSRYFLTINISQLIVKFWAEFIAWFHFCRRLKRTTFVFFAKSKKTSFVQWSNIYIWKV